MKNQYNKLYDPFMATCVCLTGQLLIVDLMNKIHKRVPDMEIIQLNTDGWVLSVPDKDVPTLHEIVGQWKKKTGFNVDTDIISKLWQRDVNNYVMEFDTGKIKAKGGTVKNWKGGDFRSNSTTIIDEALVEYMIKGTSIADTIMGCHDLERFQIILKAGSTYAECGKVGKDKETYETIPGKVHRIYAANEGFEFVKKKTGGNPARFPDSPTSALEGFIVKSIDDIDKRWYIDKAEEKLKAFI